MPLYTRGDIRKTKKETNFIVQCVQLRRVFAKSAGGWDFKPYVLSMMFYRSIFKNLTNYRNEDEIERIPASGVCRLQRSE